MNKLVTDVFVRRIAQVVLIVAAFAVMLACMSFDAIVIKNYRGSIDASQYPLAYSFVQGISAFYKNDWSTLFTTIAGVFPVIVSSVCYRISRDPVPKISEDLNHVGHTFFGLSVLTVGFLLLAMGMLTMLKPSVLKLLAETDANTADNNFRAVRELANTTLSAYAIYIVQFVGMRAK